MSDRMLRASEVTTATGLSRPTLWRRAKAGEFPAPRQLGGGLVGWLESEVNEWLQTRPVATGADR